MQMIAAGHKPAFQELYRRYGSHVLGYSRRLVRQTGVSEEVAQEAWIRVVRAAASYRGDGSLKSWLYTVVRRTAFNYLRDHVASEEVATADLEAAHATVHEFEEQVLARAEIEAVRSALDSLPGNQRLALTMWLTEDLSYDEIAGQLGVTEAAVKSLLHRARQRISDKLRGVA